MIGLTKRFHTQLHYLKLVALKAICCLTCCADLMKLFKLQTSSVSGICGWQSYRPLGCQATNKNKHKTFFFHLPGSIVSEDVWDFKAKSHLA